MTDHNNSSLPAPTLKRKTGISPIWAVPILALLLGAWLLYKNVSEAGQRIQIHFANAQGLIAGRTTLRYQGLEVGIVQNLTLAKNLEGIYVHAKVYPNAMQLLGEDTQFWLVKPSASLSGVSGLDALVSGNYIAVQSATNPNIKKIPEVFSAQPKAPQDLYSTNPEGLRLTLRSKDLGSLNIGSKILFRKIPIGEIYSFNLDKSGNSVILRAFIDEEYEDIITTESRFWNVSGVDANIGFHGVDVRVESLAALVGGGIAVDSPAQGTSVESDTEFKLYPDLATAGRGIPITIKLPDNSNIASGGAPLVYRGIDIGQITSIRLSSNRKDILATATVEPAYHDLLNSGTQFLLEEASLSLAGATNLGNFVRGNYLTLLPGDGEATREFIAVKQDELNSQDKANVSISLFADQSYGLKKGSAVVYKGITLGYVTSSQLHDNGVKINALIESQYRSLIRSHNRFYLSSALSANFQSLNLNVTIPPLQELISGSISFISAGSSKIQKQYSLYQSQELAELAVQSEGQAQPLTLLADELPSINVGSPIYYRNLPVGQVLGFKLGHAGMEVNITVQPEYNHLIGPNTVFWNHSGVEVKAGLSGIDIKAAPLARMINGGIAFDTLPGVENKIGRYHKLYPSQDAARHYGKLIQLYSSANPGVSIGTKINYQGVPVGEVTLVSPLFEKTGVEIMARIYPEYVEKVATKQTKFWMLTPQISLKGVKNLASAIVPSIEVTPSLNSQSQQRFELASVEPQGHGVTFYLQSETKGSVAIDTPILYKELEVGQVTDISLGALADRVIFTIQIDEKYAYLVRQNTHFWNVSGLDFSIGFTGANIKTGTMESMLRGGIAFSTPDEGVLKQTATEGRSFLLHQQADPVWLQWRPVIVKP
jgi:paraquat-inducible protein B